MKIKKIVNKGSGPVYITDNVNNYNNISLDDELKSFLEEHTTSSEEFEGLIKSFEIIKSNLPDESKRKHAGKLKSFLNQVANQGGQKLIELMIESGYEAWF